MPRNVSLTRVARLAYWSVHIEAWLRSGLAQEAYCTHQRIQVGKMRHWVRVLSESGSKASQASIKPALSRVPNTRSGRSKALIAFWSMHVEALNWSGLPARPYARVHSISYYSLKQWRAKLDADPPNFNWRDRLHPSARPAPTSSEKLSTTSVELSTGAPKASVQNLRSPAAEAPAGPVARPKRRTFSEEQKLAIVAEAERPRASVFSVAERHQVSTSMIFRWRNQFGLAPKKAARLATVRVVERRPRGRPKKLPPLVLHHALPIPPGSIEVTLADGRRVYAPAGTDPDVVRRFVAERERAS